jgi:cephalosporin-C deacetylase-like acetyl esterase
MCRPTLPVLAFTLTLVAFAGPAGAVDELSVLRPKPGELPPEKRLYSYLETQAKVEFDARRKAVSSLKTPADILRRQSELKVKFLQALGDLPAERTPINAKTVGRELRDGYAVERVVYESRPGYHVTANVYVPDGSPPFAGVLVPCGHSENGKAAEAYQRMSVLLARNGMIALCFDPIGQGERAQWLNEQGKPAINGSTTEHTLLGIGALLVGRSAAGYRFWDGVRSLDYLASRLDVDPARLGCTGNSGGGTMTAYLMALDDRILAAAPSCYITSLERLFATIGPQDAEQNITGQVAAGIEHADYATMRAPRATLLSVGTRDFFDIDGSWTTFREVKKLYSTLGHGERVDLFESDEPHGFTKVRRESCMRWMRRWLLGKDDAPVEPEFSIAQDRDTHCTSTGQVLSALHGKSAFDLNAERADQLAKLRSERFAERSVESLREEVRKRLALSQPQTILVENHRTIQRDGYTVDLWTLATEPGVVVCERMFRAESTPNRARPITVYVGADLSMAAPGGPIEKRVKAGEWVAMIEPRGMGETAPISKGRPAAAGVDVKEAFLALHLGRPLLAQRVYDLLQAFRALQRSDDTSGFHLIGIGQGGPIALHAAALDDRVKSVEIDRSLISWDAVARTPLSMGQLSSVVPGVLESYDLPDLAAAIAPRPLTIRAPVDPAGKPVPRESLDSTYAACRAAYKKTGAASAFELQTGAQP